MSDDSISFAWLHSHCAHAGVSPSEEICSGAALQMLDDALAREPELRKFVASGALFARATRAQPDDTYVPALEWLSDEPQIADAIRRVCVALPAHDNSSVSEVFQMLWAVDFLKLYPFTLPFAQSVHRLLDKQRDDAQRASALKMRDAWSAERQEERLLVEQEVHGRVRAAAVDAEE